MFKLYTYKGNHFNALWMIVLNIYNVHARYSFIYRTAEIRNQYLLKNCFLRLDIYGHIETIQYESRHTDLTCLLFTAKLKLTNGTHIAII